MQDPARRLHVPVMHGRDDERSPRRPPRSQKHPAGFRCVAAVWATATLLHGQGQQQAKLVSRVRVPGTANPYLAGMPEGTRSSHGDMAPRNSPALISLPPGSAAVAFEADGRVAHGPIDQHRHEPPGGSEFTRHESGAENGISDLQAPYNSLVGVFLSEDRPDQSAAPAQLKLRRAGRDIVKVSPQLRQLFYIGTGRTKSGAIRSFAVPRGATRLFLGVMDGYEWNNNDGEFGVTITLDRTDVSSTLTFTDVRSTLTFADWACLPDRSQCTPADASITDLGNGRFRVVLPAHLEWGASLSTPPGTVAQILTVRGTVCAEGHCHGPEGAGDRRGRLEQGKPWGALVSKTEGHRTYFSVNGESGPAFGKYEGFFEFEVSVR